MEKIILFYKYITIENPQAIVNWQRELCAKLSLTGRVLIAREGINATLAGSSENIEIYKKILDNHALFNHIDFKESAGTSTDFPRLQVKLKKEIVALGIEPEKLTAQDGGVHLTPAEAHEFIKNNKNLVILDGRNNYESRVGKFTGAITPDIQNFRDFPDYITKNQELFADKEVLMYCTGGIRCERASAYVKLNTEAKKVYQITGGIHRYVEQFPDGFFRGKNYVFDARSAISVNSDILSTCDLCTKACDDYTNCSNAQCNKQFITCRDCSTSFSNTCGQVCKELVINGLVKKRPFPYRATHAQQSC